MSFCLKICKEAEPDFKVVRNLAIFRNDMVMNIKFRTEINLLARFQLYYA